MSGTLEAYLAEGGRGPARVAQTQRRRGGELGGKAVVQRSAHVAGTHEHEALREARAPCPCALPLQPLQ
eukprot:5014324-Ditylum_brightwellii.AAC.1